MKCALSPIYSKQWTAYQLDLLIERTLSGAGRLLPIWHRITKGDVTREIPSVANRLALNTALLSTDDIVRDLLDLRDMPLKHFTRIGSPALESVA